MIFISLALATSRYETLDLAAQYVLHSWTSDADNIYASCSSDYQSDYSPGTHMGLPYDWGGYVTLNEFDSQISAGYGAGSHSWHGSLSCTTGVDCSGFVSELWRTGHYSTSTFYEVTHDIGWSDLEPADAINDAGSHIVLFAYETDAGDPVFYEASGSASRTRINAMSGWSYLDGYQPVRFDDIEDDAAAFEVGTPEQPIEITGFPYEDLRWTAGANSDRFDSYACSPDSDESGPEVVYHFYAGTTGTLEIVLTDDDTSSEGNDVDIHVLTTLSEAGCIARAHEELSTTVGPGDVWVVMDTWVGSHEYPGPYWMRASFSGVVGQVEDTGMGQNDPDNEENPETDLDEEGTNGEPDSAAPGLPGSAQSLSAIGCQTGTAAPTSLLGIGSLLLSAGYTRRRKERR